LSSSSSSFLPLALTDGQVLNIGIRTSKRARRLRLVSSMRGVEAVVPVSYSADELANFVASKKSWILKTSQYYSRLNERCGGSEPGTIYFLGSRYKFHVVKDRADSSATIVSDTMKVITFHVADRRMYKHHIQEWYRQQTGRIIAERLPLLSARLNLQYNRVSIKNQKSRWGSCSRKRNLNFNLLLSATPLEVIDYVIIHELMHLIELDHSKRFWQLVSSADPEYKEHREWLASHAPAIKIG
jgi:predicted metal-dependent hydrolase